MNHPNIDKYLLGSVTGPHHVQGTIKSIRLNLFEHENKIQNSKVNLKLLFNILFETKKSVLK